MVQNSLILRHLIIQFPMRVSAVEYASEASSVEQMREQCERTYEQTSKWPSTYISIHGCSKPQWAFFPPLLFFGLFPLWWAESVSSTCRRGIEIGFSGATATANATHYNHNYTNFSSSRKRKRYVPPPPLPPPPPPSGDCGFLTPLLYHLSVLLSYLPPVAHFFWFIRLSFFPSFSAAYFYEA